MISLLEFDDAGAGDNHPAKGVTVGHIRAWHDEIERLRVGNEMLKAALEQAIKREADAKRRIDAGAAQFAASVKSLNPIQ